jgi:hypothetical protein
MSTLTAYDVLKAWFEVNWTFTARVYENESSYSPTGAGGALHSSKRTSRPRNS